MSKSKVSKLEQIERAEEEIKMLKMRGKALKEKEKIVVPIEEDLSKELLEKSIRPIEGFVLKTRSSDRVKQRLELIKYLFVKYSVPKILEQIWYKPQEETNPNQNQNRYLRNNRETLTINYPVYQNWYICAATGGSLHKEYLKDFLTKKETHAFMSCNKPLNINRAIYYATAICAGANEGVAFRVAKSKIAEKSYKNNFWRDCARFFAINETESINQINDLVDYLEYRWNENNDFSIFGQGFTVKTLLDRMKDWHYDLRRIKEHSNYTWEGYDIPSGEYIRKDEHGKEFVWTMTQIVKGKDLAEEGNKMHHCVYSYKQSCMSGSCSIWSLRVRPNEDWGYVQEKRVATIEIRRDLTVAQARGFANRHLKSNEQTVLALWCRENGIGYKNSY